MHVNPGLRHSNKIQGYAWNLAFLLQCLGCYRCFFFTSGFCITGMSPCWIQVEFWDSGSSVCVLISGVWRISARGVRKCLKHRGCFTQNLHCQKNTLPRSALWRIPDKQCSWISDLRRPSSCWWVQKTLLLWAMPGWAGRGGCSLFIPSTVLSSKHFRASSSSRQSLINCQPTGVIWGLNHHFSNLLLLW